MDVISAYLRKGNLLSVHVLINCIYRLQVKELRRLNLSFLVLQQTVEEVLPTLPLETIAQSNVKSIDPGNSIETERSLADIKQSDRDEIVSVYSGILYEACLIPKITVDGPALVLRKGLQQDTERSVLILVEELLRRRHESEEAILYEKALQDWMMQGRSYFQQERGEKITTKSNPFEENEQERLGPPPFEVEKDGDVSVEDGSRDEEQRSERLYRDFPVNNGFNINMNLAETNNPGMREMNDFQRSIETNEAMIKFLAHIRKSGMDLILPQTLHDKVLLAMYVVAKVGAPLAHRQLMDLVLDAKKAGVLGRELETVSKTKIRGVLSLVKNSHSLHAGGGSGESVKLYLGKGVTNFRSFREKHDSFVTRCIVQQEIFLPMMIKAEVLWLGDERAIQERCLEAEQAEVAIEQYFMSRKNEMAAFNSPSPPPSSLLMQSNNRSSSLPGAGFSRAPAQDYFNSQRVGMMPDTLQDPYSSYRGSSSSLSSQAVSHIAAAGRNTYTSSESFRSMLLAQDRDRDRDRVQYSNPGFPSHAMKDYAPMPSPSLSTSRQFPYNHEDSFGSNHSERMSSNSFNSSYNTINTYSNNNNSYSNNNSYNNNSNNNAYERSYSMTSNHQRYPTVNSSSYSITPPTSAGGGGEGFHFDDLSPRGESTYSPSSSSFLQARDRDRDRGRNSTSSSDFLSSGMAGDAERHHFSTYEK